jgi:hypothetical protein
MYFTLIIAFLLIPISFAAGETCVKNKETTVILNIEDATYFAADADGIENDVIAHFTLEVLRNRHNARNTAIFYILISLTLPSGYCYDYLFQVISDYNILAYITLIFYDHATEPGWYLLEITAILPSYGGYSYCIGTESYYFDPPGSDEGTNPDGCTLLT